MKNIKFLRVFLILTLGIVTLNSCDELLDPTETDFGKGPILAQFEKPSVTANFIKDGSVTSYNVPLTIIGGRNQSISTPVEITISADASSTANSGTEYTLETTTFTIPAGELSVNAVINVNTANLDPFDAKTLVLKIDSSSQGVSETNTTSVILQAVCSLDLSNFVGNYTSTTTRVSGSRTSTVELGPEPNSLLITNAEAYGTDKILVVLSTDVTNPTITYIGNENFFIYSHSTYGPVWASTLTPEQSTYNSCDFSMNLEFKRCVSIGCFGGSRVITMVKQ
ncbi:DUF1735 domain-containing protein [Mariniflexile sp. AS56]|uniref:DUF1735 domain-containing protein n=1 Tax=Mariniflexile sp. AS56 TaxID=3063957 RepID=UPI0026F01117|nr:DUF1735 domain-containing protein [Mariniflexile sp. AS56]MDO7170751.1 DUF1735 domain-containing protein [Mariniflexile sp. AS56]